MQFSCREGIKKSTNSEPLDFFVGYHVIIYLQSYYLLGHVFFTIHCLTLWHHHTDVYLCSRCCHSWPKGAQCGRRRRGRGMPKPE